MNAIEVILFVVMVIGSIIGISITRGIRRQVDVTRIREEDGHERLLSVDERIDLASRAALERGRWFWPLLLSGVVLVAICSVVLWRLGFIEH